MLKFTRRHFSKLPTLSDNYFEIFSLPLTFQIDVVKLARKYRSLQGSFHPDKHVGSTVDTQEQAAQNSALLNKAYSCLRDPYCRARTLLKSKGQNPDVSVLDAEFLSDMLDFNDQIELCDDPGTLKQLRKHNEEALAELYRQFALYFDAGDLQTAADRLSKVKFLMQSMNRLELRTEVVG